MIDGIYDKTSKISFSTYGDDFLRYFGEYKRIVEELGTEVHTLYGTHGDWTILFWLMMALCRIGSLN